MNEILARALEIGEELKQIRHTLHQNPETGEHLPETTAFVMDELRKLGLEPVEICESGVAALLSSGSGGKTILLRADMDALPTEEKTCLDFKSENGCMHACGHDMHTTMLLGAARILTENRDKLNGTVKLVFQPNEEGFGGAKKMIAAGVLENPVVDAAMALHVNSGSPSGMIIHGRGNNISGCIRFRITVNGVGCHGAMPHTGVDPINAAVHIYLAIQEIITREIEAAAPVVLTIGKFNAGEAANMIPSSAVMEGTLRFIDKDIGERAFARINSIADCTAKAFRCEAVTEELSSVLPLKNDDKLTDELSACVKALIGSDKVVEFSGSGMGSEDFAEISYRVPSAYFMLGAGTAAENPLYGKPMHNPEVVFNEDILPLGAAILAECALSWLAEHSDK